MKRCRVCGETKSTDGFHKSKARADGLQYVCRGCHSAAVRANQARNAARHRAGGPADLESKNCPGCLTVRPATDFALDAHTPSGMFVYCRPCDSDIQLRHKYGVGLLEYEELLSAQNGRCALCDRPPGRRRLGVDPCHETGLVRGLLCPSCNGVLEKFARPEMVAAAEAYKSDPPAVRVLGRRYVPGSVLCNPSPTKPATSTSLDNNHTR